MATTTQSVHIVGNDAQNVTVGRDFVVDNTYNYTQQEFPSEEAPGLSVFYKDPAGEIYHTYSTYGRGLETLLSTYMLLDLVPKGRDEHALAFTMAWVRYHDRYGTDQFADADKPYWPETDVRPATICGCDSTRPGA